MTENWSKPGFFVTYQLWQDEEILYSAGSMDELQRVCRSSYWEPKGTLRVVVVENFYTPVVVIEDPGVQFKSKEQALAEMEQMGHRLQGRFMQ